MTPTENRATFFARLSGRLPGTQIELVSLAYDLAKYGHRGQVRRNGPRYFEHPRAVALILIDELELLDADLLCAALLHDVVEDSAILGTMHQAHGERWRIARWRITKLFNPRVARLVLTVTKPSLELTQFHTKAELTAHYLRGLRRGSVDALLIKMCDRLHNLRSLEGSSPETIRKQLTETREVLLPIFQRARGSRPREAPLLLERIEAAMVALSA